MPTPQAHLAEFELDIRRQTFWFRENASSLRGLLVELRRQIGANAVVHFDPLLANPDTGIAAAKAFCANPNDRRLDKYEPALRRLVDCWSSTLKDYPINVVRANANVTPGGAAKLVRNKLEAMEKFASMDAFFGCPRVTGQPPANWGHGFAGCIKPSKRQDVMDRHDAAAARGARSGVGGGGIAGFGIKDVRWKESELRKAHQKIHQEQAGICILFAKAAGYILGSGLSHGPRIEVVSYKNHAFVVIGRGGGYSTDGQYTLPNYTNWTGDWVIVDGWAGAMGYPTIYQKDAGYPYKTMLNPVSLVMEKTAW